MKIDDDVVTGQAAVDLGVVKYSGVDASNELGAIDGTGFKSGSSTSRKMALWTPALRSADDEVLPGKALTEARTHDLTRNAPMPANAVRNRKDNIVGNHFRLSLQPSRKLLPGVSEERLKEWVDECETKFHAYADDPECWIDAQRQKTFVDFCRSSVASDIFAGEYFISREWRPSPIGYRTCFRGVEPERVKTPLELASRPNVRGGVVKDRFGAPVAYYVQNPQRNKTELVKYKKITRYNQFGWLQFLHVFEPDRENQTRGYSPFAPAIEKIKMTDRYEDVELEAAIMAATYSIYVESDLGAASIFDALKGGAPTKDLTGLIKAQKAYAEKAENSPIFNDGKKLVHLFPNEKIKMLESNHPVSGFESFEAAMHRHAAKALGMTYEEYSGNYSDTTYNSARASMLAAWKFIRSKRQNVPAKVATFIFRTWLSEAVSIGAVTPPVDFWPNRAALTRCSWIGAGREDIDELKSARSNEIKLRTGETSLHQLAAQAGLDYEDLFNQREREISRKIEAMRARGVEVNEQIILSMYQR